ncbi:LysR family transcriptional regulator [Paraburkholderia antibiotica]|uniref:LysR family transcriptional regulator n=1 Tax=Paraburkholderia antibiotica TaxID=2728839 RepID=A0A7X9X386_9BURK|nr:LysR family transcriptional regulator [Paraburkholderia antibiotica]NML30586.1 LysR family transcriptional regulator [Paraburkholderia antibiotica]
MPPAEKDSEGLRRLVGRLRFRHLHILLTLEESGSLHSAARLLNVTQPALSKALVEVESAFGVPLFERDARGVVPTQYGTTVLRGAKLLMGELERLRQETLSDSQILSLNVGAPHFIAQGYLPGVFQRLLSLDASIRVKMVEAAVPDLFLRLQEGELDFLISSLDLPSMRTEALDITKLFTANMEVIAATAHPLTERRSVSWDMLSNERWILPPADSLLTRSVVEMFSQEGLAAPEPIVNSSQPSTNLQLVAENVGISVLPSPILRSQAAGDKVRTIRVSPPLPRRPVALIRRKGPEERWLPPLLEALKSSV